MKLTEWIKRFASGLRRATSPLDDVVRYIEPPEYTIEGLRHDFNRRTWSYDWHRERLEETDPRLLNWIGSIDGSGYVRERCLRSLIENYEPGDENRILLRLEDWVPKVHDIAGSWVLDHFAGLSFDAIRENDRLLLYLSCKERLVGDEAMEAIHDRLLSETKISAKQTFYSLNAGLRKHIYNVSIHRGRPLRELILKDPEPFNRLLLLSDRRLLPLQPDELVGLHGDKSIFVRRRYVQWRIDSDDPLSKEELTELVFDRNRGLRELGRFYFEKNHEVDAYELYKEREDDLFFLVAEYAKKEDMEHFLTGAKTANRQLRILCVRAICLVDAQKLLALDVPSLISTNRKTRALVCMHLHRILSVEEIQALRGVFETASGNGIVSYLNVILKKSYWQFIDEALGVLQGDPSEETFDFIRSRIGSKVAVYEKLSDRLRESIEDKVSELRDTSDRRWTDWSSL